MPEYSIDWRFMTRLIPLLIFALLILVIGVSIVNVVFDPHSSDDDYCQNYAMQSTGWMQTTAPYAVNAKVAKRICTEPTWDYVCSYDPQPKIGEKPYCFVPRSGRK